MIDPTDVAECPARRGDKTVFAHENSAVCWLCHGGLNHNYVATEIAAAYRLGGIGAVAELAGEHPDDYPRLLKVTRLYRDLAMTADPGSRRVGK